MLVRRKLIRELAINLLERAEIKRPAVGVDVAARELGITIVETPGDRDELSGFLLRNQREKSVIIGVNEAHHDNRKRFTVAHEIGHFLLHEGEPLHIDKRSSGYEIKMRSAESSAGRSVDEMEANLFAAELLMPVHFIDVDLAKISSQTLSEEAKIQKLAEKYQVSPQAMTLRLTYLGCIPQ